MGPSICDALKRHDIPLELDLEGTLITPTEPIFAEFCLKLADIAKRHTRVQESQFSRIDNRPVDIPEWTPKTIAVAAKFAKANGYLLRMSVAKPEGSPVWTAGGGLTLNMMQAPGITAQSIQETLQHEQGHLRDMAMMQALFPQDAALFTKQAMTVAEGDKVIRYYLAALISKMHASQSQQFLADAQTLFRGPDLPIASAFTYVTEMLRYGEEVQCASVAQQAKRGPIPPVFRTAAQLTTPHNRALIAARYQVAGHWDTLAKRRGVVKDAVAAIDPTALRFFAAGIRAARAFFPKPQCGK